MKLIRIPELVITSAVFLNSEMYWELSNSCFPITSHDFIRCQVSYVISNLLSFVPCKPASVQPALR